MEAGSFEDDVLSESVWDRAVAEGDVDTSRVRKLSSSPPDFDYHWVASPEIDEVYGKGTTDRIVDVLLTMDEAGPEAQRILAMFEDDSFVEANDENYTFVEEVARDLVSGLMARRCEVIAGSAPDLLRHADYSQAFRSRGVMIAFCRCRSAG